MAVAGLPSALCESSITEITKGEYPLTLFSGDTITLDMRVKKVFPGDLRLAADELSVDDPDGSDKESDGSDEDSVDSLLPVFMYLRNYELNYGGRGKHSDAVRRLSDEFSAALKAKRDVCVINAKKDGCGFLIDSIYAAGKRRG